MQTRVPLLREVTTFNSTSTWDRARSSRSLTPTCGSTSSITSTSTRRATHPSGNAPDLDAECTRFEAEIKLPAVRVTFLGLGRNGHIGFNERRTVDSRTRVVELTESTTNGQRAAFPMATSRRARSRWASPRSSDRVRSCSSLPATKAGRDRALPQRLAFRSPRPRCGFTQTCA